jgi:integrase
VGVARRSSRSAVSSRWVRAEDIDFFTYLQLFVITGARRSQLLALHSSDVDFTHAGIGFCRALVDGPTGPVLGPTKNWRTYRVALDPTSVELLVVHRDPAAARADAWSTGSCSAATRGVIQQPKLGDQTGAFRAAQAMLCSAGDFRASSTGLSRRRPTPI